MINLVVRGSEDVKTLEFDLEQDGAEVNVRVDGDIVGWFQPSHDGTSVVFVRITGSEVLTELRN